MLRNPCNPWNPWFLFPDLGFAQRARVVPCLIRFTEKLAAFTAWAKAHITGDEKGQAQIFLNRLFIAFGHAGSLDVGGEPVFRVRQATEDGGGTSFAGYVWKPVVKKRGAVLSWHYRQAFDCWTRLVPGRPRYVVLCNFDELHVHDFETQMEADEQSARPSGRDDRW